MAYQHVREEAQPPSVYDPEVRPEIDAIVLKALAKDRDYRYQSADEMRDDIERFLDGLPVAAAQQAAAFGMGGYGYDQNGYPAQQHDPYGQTNLLPQHGGAAPTTMLPPVGNAQQGYGQYQQNGYDDGNDGYDGGRASRRREEPPRKSNTSWIILAVAAVLVLVGSFFVASAMFKGGGGSGSGTQVAAPTLVGKTLADATTTVHTAGTRLQIAQGTPIPCADQPKDSVCKQSPAAGTQMSASGTITVQLSTGPAQATVPPLNGMTRDAATKAITDAGLQLGTISYANDQSVPQDSVISSSPGAGSKVDPNSTVTLTVSSGVGTVAVPSVLGMTTDVATQTLTGANFTVDASKTTPTSDQTKIGTVASQSATKAAPGAKITLTIYAAPAMAQVPPLQNQTVTEAINTLKKAGLTWGIGSGPSDPNAIVVSSAPSAGTQVPPNTQIMLNTQAAPAKGGTPSAAPSGGPHRRATNA